jgi:hypothetical protein
MKKEDENKWREELNDAPDLSRFSAADPFEAPAGYFDNFSSSVIDRINSAKDKPAFSLSALLKKPVVSIPALVIVVAGLIWMINRKADEKKEYISMNYDDIYNSALVTDLDESTMCEFIDMETTNTPNTSEEELLLETVSEESLINEL